MDHQEKPNSQNPPPADAAAPDGANRSASLGDDVLSMIGDVEKQLARLREAQADQSQQIASLAERAEALDRMEREMSELAANLQSREQYLQQQDQELQKKQQQIADSARQVEHGVAELESQRKEIESQQAAIDSQREQAQHEHAEAQQQLEQRATELMKREANLASEQKSHESQQQKIAESQQKLEDRSGELQQELQQLRDDKRQLSEKLKAAEASAKELTEIKAKFEKAVAGLHEAQSRFQTLHFSHQESQKLNEELKRLAAEAQQQATQAVEKQEAAAAALAKRDADLSRSRETLEQTTARLGEAEKRAAQAEKAIAQAEKKAEQIEAQKQEIEAKKQEIEAKLQQREQTMAENRKKLETASAKLHEFSQILSEQGPQLERGAAAIAEVQDLRRQVDQMQKKLAQARLAGDPQELHRKDERIAELTEALREARGQKPVETDVSELEHRIHDLNAALDEARMQAAEGASQVDQLKSEIRQLKQRGAASAESSGEINSLQQQVKTLKAQLAAAEATAQPAQSGKGGDSKTKQQLRAKAEQLNAAAAHLQRRRARLQYMRHLMNEKAASIGITEPGQKLSHEDYEDRARELAEIQQQRMQLEQMHESLERTQKQMMRKWARPKAVVVLGWLSVFLAFAAVASWLAANRFFPATVAASVTVQAEPNPGRELSDDDRESWRKWHAELLRDPTFHGAVAKRLGALRLDQYSEVSALSRKLSADLTSDTPQPDQIRLTLASQNREEVSLMLDAIATTLAAESARQVGRRSDGAKAVVLGGETVRGQLRYASLNARPVSDNRLMWTGILMIVLTFSGCVAVSFIYRRLLRSKAKFETANAVLSPETDDADFNIPIR